MDLYRGTSFVSPDETGFELVDRSLEEEMVARTHQAMAEQLHDSLALFDLGVVVKRLQFWKECFLNVEPYYSVKACNHPTVLKLLAFLGASFDCTSKHELEAVLKAGVQPEKIIFAHTIKFPSHIQFAMENNIQILTFDNQTELYKIKKIFPDSRLLLRITPSKIGQVKAELSGKFGCLEKTVTSLLKLTMKLGLKLIGLSFHVGGCCLDVDRYVDTIRTAKKIFDEALEMGIQMELLDIGGGFKGAASTEEYTRKISSIINGVLDECFPRSSGIRLIAEPGRFFVESAMMVATCIIGKKDQKEIPAVLDVKGHVCQQDDVQYYISESKYGLLGYDFLFDQPNYKPIVISRRTLSEKRLLSGIWGPTNDPVDAVPRSFYLPELEPGDWLLFSGLGAYTEVRASEFNGIPIGTVKRIMNRQLWNELQGTATCE